MDQIFIGQGVGYLGNAATNVSYPLSTICLAISLLIGIGSAARFSLFLGREEPDRAAHLVGNGILLMAGAGILYLLIGEVFSRLFCEFSALPRKFCPLPSNTPGLCCWECPSSF